MWLLAVTFWLHMLATVAWIGGLATLAWLVLPAARKQLTVEEYAYFLVELQKRFDPIAWFSLAVLAGTGMVQLGANPNYQGLLKITHLWSGVILIKHILFLGMAAISAYLTWVLLPQLNRLALQRLRIQDFQKNSAQVLAVDQAEAQSLRQEERLMRINLILGVFVLALTAIARSV